jgi:hypothetical protein
MENEIKLLAPPKGRTFRVPEENLETLREKIAKLNKEAGKLGCVPVRFDIVRTEEHKNPDTGAIRTFFHVYVEGEAPKLKGWTFLGALTHAPEGNIVRLVPGKEVPASYRTAKPICDYCKKDWIVRRDTYIVQNDQGEYKQVGGNCLADFLGHPDPYRYASYAEALAGLAGELEDLEEERVGRGGIRFDREDLKIFLAEVAAVIDEKGWVSRGEAYQSGSEATADRALSELQTQPHTYQGRRVEPIRPEKKHLEEAEKVISFMRIELKPTNDYQSNLKVLTSTDNFLVKEGSGIVASAVPYYRREVEKRLAQEREAKQFANSEFVGQVGDRLYDIPITVVGYQQIEGAFGETNIIRMQDEKGNVFTWFASTGKTSMQMEVGQSYVISGTVKKHQEWKGRKETMLSRVKLEG